MIVFLRILFAAILVAMLAVTIGASLQQGVVEAVLLRQQRAGS